MKEVARRGLVSFFGINLSTKEPDEIHLYRNALTTGGVFVWRLRTKSGALVETFGADLADPGTWVFLERSLAGNFADRHQYDFGSGYGIFHPPGRYVMAPIVMIIFSLGLFFWQKVYTRRASSQNLAVALLVGLCSAAVTPTRQFAAPDESPVKFMLPGFIAPVISFSLGTLLSYATLNVVLYYLSRRLPIQVSNYLALWRQGLRVRTAGLELLRGIFAGMVFSCTWIALISLSGFWGKAFVGMISLAAAPFYGVLENLTSAPTHIMLWLTQSPFDRTYDFSGGLLRFYVLFILAEALSVPWLLVALPLSLLAKVTARVPILIAVLVSLWLGLGFSLAGAMAFPRIPYYVAVGVQAAFLGVVFLRYGMLATSSAVLTLL